MKRVRYLRLVEFGLWVLVASTAVILGSLFLGLVVGRDLLTGKYITFAVGFLLFGIGSLMIQPARPHESAQFDRSTGGGGVHSGGFGSASPGNGDGDSDSPVDPDVDISTLRKRVQSQKTHQHRYEAKLQQIGPLADAELPFERRVSRGVKIFVTGLVVLGFSFVMEVVGVQI